MSSDKLPEPYYERDGITIYHADAREISPYLEADIIITDPPYGIGWTRGVHAARNSKSHPGIQNDHDTSTRDIVLAQFPNTPAIVFGSFYAPFPYGVRQVLVWEKPPDSGVVGSTTGFRRDAEPVFLTGPWPHRNVKWTSILKSYSGSASAVAAETGHPHTKPIGLIRTLMERSPEGVVLDPFGGSGTTAMAAMQLGRKAIVIEIEEEWCFVAVKRLQQQVLPLGMPA